MSLQPSLPKAIFWNRVFCWVMVVLNAVAAVVMLNLSVFSSLDDLIGGMLGDSLRIFMAALGAILAILNLVMAILPLKPWVYLCHLINLSVSAAGCIWAPFCAPLLIAYRSEAVQRAYGMETEPPSFKLGR
ncbi:MAG: hypothetical protein JST40_06650 [Armatimonadetes bacterium]|nr:hypothetical protein [Armatimonadota bacterium]